MTSLRLLLPLALSASLLLSGCSPVRVNGSYRTADDQLCLVVPRHVQPDIHEKLVELLRKKNFDVIEYPSDTKPGVCRQTLIYSWDTEQYYLPAYVKQHAINLDLYVEGRKFANASFDPRRLYTPQTKFIRFSRYLARVLDRLFPAARRSGRKRGASGGTSNGGAFCKARKTSGFSVKFHPFCVFLPFVLHV